MKPHISIGTIGHVDHGRTTLSRAIAKVLSDETLVIVCEPQQDFDLEINGVKYIERNKPKYSRGVAHIASMLAMTGGLHGLYSGYERERPQVNIIEEFKLIQDKKSKLCRNDREWVQYQFNQLYKEIDL